MLIKLGLGEEWNFLILDFFLGVAGWGGVGSGD